MTAPYDMPIIGSHSESSLLQTDLWSRWLRKCLTHLFSDPVVYVMVPWVYVMTGAYIK